MTDRGRDVDRFVEDALPPRALWPRMEWSGLPDPGYPERLNAAAELLDTWIAAGHGNRTVFHHDGGPWSYQRLFETANRIAHVLVTRFGLIPGSRVLLRAPNQPMLAACWFAVIKAGGVAVTTMPLLRVRELKEIIAKAKVTIAMTDARVAAELEEAGGADVRVVRFNDSSFEALMATAPAHFDNADTGADSPAIIAFTSGTTGRAKGTVHFHRDLLAITDTYCRHVVRPNPEDVFIGSPPLAFTYGLGGLVLFPMRFGASAALLEQATPALLLEGIQRYRATITVTSPTGYRAMVKLAPGFDLSSLRNGISAGETLPAATFEAWRDAVGVRLMDGIGSTEMLHMFIGCDAGSARAGATGRVVPGYRAIVVDEDGAEVPVGTIGRLAVSGPTGCRYLGDLDNQRKYVQHGWNLTGDAYRVDQDGYFWYQARTDDMIVTSGYNVSGVEVENVLMMHAAVGETAVVGVSDEARGQIVKAFVVPADGSGGSEALGRELQEFVKAQLAPYKYPRAVEFVRELPRTLTGKIQRFRLRQEETPMADSRAETSATSLAVHQPADWPRPAGYANAVSATGRSVFVAGQVGWNPVTARFETDDFAGQVRQALANIVTALGAAGAGVEHITRLTWYVTDRDEYLLSRKAIGAHYREILGRHFPAMSVVVVKDLVEPGAKVEIEATAVVG